MSYVPLPRVPGPDGVVRGPNGRHLFDPKRLQDRYKEIARRVALGQRNADIAKDLSLSPATVSQVRNSRLLQGELQRLHGIREAALMQVGESLAKAAPKAVEVLEHSLESDFESVRIKAATEVLDRFGVSKVQKIDARHTTCLLSEDDIAELTGRAKAAGLVVETAPANAQSALVPEVFSTDLDLTEVDGLEEAEREAEEPPRPRCLLGELVT